MGLTGSEGHAPEPIRDCERDLLRSSTSASCSGSAASASTASRFAGTRTSSRSRTSRSRRNPNVRMYGGIRFGGTMLLDDAWELGFDHVAIAAGAGRPTLIDIKNNLARGMRKASDFLMALQLTGAYKHTSIANLQISLPAIVIGGGLTAIDTATELLAYYLVQIEKTLERWQSLEKSLDERGASAPLRRRRDAPDARARRARQGAPRRERGGQARRTRAQRAGPARQVGRRHARLPKEPAGVAGVPSEPRRGGQEPRGGRAVRREPRADRGRGRRARSRHGDALRRAATGRAWSSRPRPCASRRARAPT